jgi:glycosyltransferase involved in cell wall biosynthesis
MISITFSSSIFSSTVYGGISRYFTELGLALNRLPDVSVSFVAPVYTNSYLARTPPSLVFGHHLSRLPGSARINPIINSLIEPHLLQMQKPSILHYTYYAPIYKRSFGSKVVVTVFDMIHELYPQFFDHSDTTTAQKLAAIRSADHIIAISESTKNDLLEYFHLPDEKVSVVYLASSLTPILTKQKLPKACRPYILYVGDRGGYKNFSALLKAYATSKYLSGSFDLICIGGHPFGENELAYITTNLVRKDSVKRVSCDDAHLSLYLSNAALLCYPSLYEGFGLPLLEAAAHNCPVVCSNIPVFVEIMGDSAYYFDPHSVISIRTALETVLAGSSIQQRMIMLAGKTVQKYSWNRCAIETHSVYKKLIASP